MLGKTAIAGEEARHRHHALPHLSALDAFAPADDSPDDFLALGERMGRGREGVAALTHEGVGKPDPRRDHLEVEGTRRGLGRAGVLVQAEDFHRASGFCRLPGSHRVVPSVACPRMLESFKMLSIGRVDRRLTQSHGLSWPSRALAGARCHPRSAGREPASESLMLRIEAPQCAGAEILESLRPELPVGMDRNRNCSSHVTRSYAGLMNRNTRGNQSYPECVLMPARRRQSLERARRALTPRRA